MPLVVPKMTKICVQDIGATTLCHFIVADACEVYSSRAWSAWSCWLSPCTLGRHSRGLKLLHRPRALGTCDQLSPLTDTCLREFLRHVSLSGEHVACCPAGSGPCSMQDNRWCVFYPTKWICCGGTYPACLGHPATDTSFGDIYLYPSKQLNSSPHRKRKYYTESSFPLSLVLLYIHEMGMKFFYSVLVSFYTGINLNFQVLDWYSWHQVVMGPGPPCSEFAQRHWSASNPIKIYRKIELLKYHCNILEKGWGKSVAMTLMLEKLKSGSTSHILQKAKVVWINIPGI